MPSRLDMRRPWTSFDVYDRSWSPEESYYRPDPGYYRSMYGQPERSIPDYLPPVSPVTHVPEYTENYRKQFEKQKWAMSRTTRLDGPPRLRSGRLGAPWRHIKQTVGHSGAHIMFIEGTVKQEDAKLYPPYGWSSSVEPDSARVYTYSPQIQHHYGTIGNRTKKSRYESSYNQHARNGLKYWYEEKKPSKFGQHLTIKGRQLVLGEAR